MSVFIVVTCFLVQGTWNNIARLSKEDADWVVLGQPFGGSG